MNTASTAAPFAARPATAPTAASSAERALKSAATAWCAVAALGQLVFACYVAALYGGTALSGRFDLWNTVMPHGFMAQAPLHNTMIRAHLLFAVLLTSSGLMQLLPVVRRRWPRLHRWNGRSYMVAAVIASISGLVMVWTPPGTVGDLSQHLATTLNAALILLSAVMAWRAALQRRFDLHRQWALRLFLLVGGVWFFRIGLMLWLILNRGPAGFDPHTFQGPALTILAFGQSLLPLAVLQLYLHVQQRRTTTGQWLTAALLGILTLATLAGIAAATALMWLPPLLKTFGPKGLALIA
jgi:hypothetical protein